MGEIGIVLGTRPEIIKLSPVIRELEKRNEEYFVIHTGQHYSYNLDKIFFEELDLPEPEYRLDVGSGTHAEQTARIMVGVERIVGERKPSVVVVQGDTNSTLGGALAPRKIQIPVAHVEAGLRSRDWRMPEEINRIIVDHISSYLFAPTPEARKNLVGEGILEERIWVTGNTVVDAVYQNREIAEEKSEILKNLGIKREYGVLTLHRAENVDDPGILRDILEGVREVSREYVDLIFPMHPRTRKRIREFFPEFLEDPGRIRIVGPLGYLDFLKLEAHASIVLTDSGGIQEEACILQVPCVTLRTSTERPETVRVGANVVAGVKREGIVRAVEEMMGRKGWKNPFGDGEASKKIVDVLVGDDENG